MSRLSSFGFSGTIAHGAFSTLGGSTLRDDVGTPSAAASRYRGHLADAVGLSPLLQTDVRGPRTTRTGGSVPFVPTGLRFALGGRLARSRVTGTMDTTAAGVVNYCASSLCESRGPRFPPAFASSAGHVASRTIQTHGRAERVRVHSGRRTSTVAPGFKRPDRGLDHEAAKTDSRVCWDAEAEGQTVVPLGTGSEIEKARPAAQRRVERLVVDMIFSGSQTPRGLLPAVASLSRAGANMTAAVL